MKPTSRRTLARRPSRLAFSQPAWRHAGCRLRLVSLTSLAAAVAPRRLRHVEAARQLTECSVRPKRELRCLSARRVWRRRWFTQRRATITAFRINGFGALAPPHTPACRSYRAVEQNIRGCTRWRSQRVKMLARRRSTGELSCMASVWRRWLGCTARPRRRAAPVCAVITLHRSAREARHAAAPPQKTTLG